MLPCVFASPFDISRVRLGLVPRFWVWDQYELLHVPWMALLCNFAPEWVWSIVITMSVCLSICPLTYLRNHTTDTSFCACCLWSWLGPPLTYDIVLRYVLPVLWMTSWFYTVGSMARHVYMLITRQPFHVDLRLLYKYRTLIGRHILWVKCNRWHACCSYVRKCPKSCFGTF